MTEPSTPTRFGPSLLQGLVLVALVALLAGFGGWWWAQPEHPSASSVDAGFLHDMSTHHLQAIGLANHYIEFGDDAALKHMAREVATYQASEIGWMNTLLSQWGDPPPGEVMSWMEMRVPTTTMPGLASDDEVAAFRAARGLELDDQFSRLMISHHAGGLHMAEYAAEHATTSEVRERARAMADGQRSEIAELNQERVRLGLPIFRG